MMTCAECGMEPAVFAAYAVVITVVFAAVVVTCIVAIVNVCRGR